jgi:hypothetical protein
MLSQSSRIKAACAAVVACESATPTYFIVPAIDL